ncbi:MAG: stalk domain-containing protein, partial [Acidobacteriota bacterium]|nr:stalk domain-containing protein [Acidobacteriota bacterium]
NNNNSLLIASEELADNYTTEFNEMWNGEFGTTSPVNTPYPNISVGDIDIQCYFAPEDHVEEHIVSVIDNAKSSIDFAAFTFTSIPIKEAIIKKIKQGVKVRGIYEARQKSQWCTYDDLKEAGASVIYDKNPKTMHHKVFIIDSEIVITGSYNPTKHANKANDENILIIADSNLAKQYEKEFNNLFYEWGGVDIFPVGNIFITLHPDDPYMTVNGVSQEIDPGRRGTTSVIIPEWSRTVVPIRAIVEALGGTIGWENATRKVTINFKGTVIELWIDNPKAKVNGIEVWIDIDNHDVKPIIVNDRTMLPLRFVAESLGCTVSWDNDTRTITITYGG